MMRSVGRSAAAAAALAGVLGLGATSGCGKRTPRPAAPAGPSTVRLGDCADPGRDGVISARPDPRRADRDLDGDGREEIVVADGRMCGDDGNCHWNIFTDSGGCQRYRGTVAGAAIETLHARGDEGFRDLRAWWRFGGGRMLVQEYRYRAGAYHIDAALMCRETEDARVLCESR